MTAPDPNALLAKAEALAAKATKGPLVFVADAIWDTTSDGQPGVPLYRLDKGAHRHWGRDVSWDELALLGAFLAASRTLIPALCAALRQALAEVGQYRSAPLVESVERILDEHSAWIARPSPDVTKAVALAAGIAGMEINRRASSDYERHLEAENERLRAPVEVTDEMVEAGRFAGISAIWEVPFGEQAQRDLTRNVLTAALAARRPS